MKYNVGDKVRVRQWDDMEKEFGLDFNGNDISVPNCGFVKEMRKYCGFVVTIHNLTCKDIKYFIEEDDGYFFWTDDMFEDIDSDSLKTHDVHTDWLKTFNYDTKDLKQRIHKLKCFT